LKSFSNIVKDYPGNVNLKVSIYDATSNVFVSMFSKTMKLEISNSLIEFLRQNNYTYKLN
ncbi:MAG: hypothetical protein R3Y51_07195, partial [Rikenellaceae bacterium]